MKRGRVTFLVFSQIMAIGALYVVVVLIIARLCGSNTPRPPRPRRSRPPAGVVDLSARRRWYRT